MTFSIIAEGDDPIKRETIHIQIFAGYFTTIRPGWDFPNPREQ